MIVEDENNKNGDNTPEKHKKAKNDWYPGMESPNPAGKPKGAISYSKKLDEALNQIETLKGKNLFKRFIERAFITDKVLIAAMKKFVPDKQHTEVEGNLNQNVDLSSLSIKELKALAYGYTIKKKPS